MRTAFALYQAPAATLPPATKTHPNPVAEYHEAQIAAMDPTGARTRLFSRAQRDSAKVGDVLLVQTRRAAEPFAGVC